MMNCHSLRRLIASRLHDDVSLKRNKLVICVGTRSIIDEALINYRLLTCATKTFSGFSFARCSVCTQPDTMSMSLFTLLYSPQRPDRIWMIQACFILKTVLSIKRPMQEDFYFLFRRRKALNSDNRDRRRWCWNDHHFCLQKLLSLSLCIRRYYHLKIECEIQQLTVTQALTNIILNLLVFPFSVKSMFCRNSHVLLSSSLLRLYSLQTKHMKGFHRI